MRNFIYFLTIIFFYTTPSFASIYINEVVASNTTYEVEGEYPDWIELYNDDSTTADIGGWYMSDKKSKLKYQLPENTVIEPKSYLLIYADDKGEGLHLNFKISEDGEKIFLFDSKGEIINNVETPSLGDDISYGRLTDGSNTMVRFTPPSPAAPNDPSKVLTSTPVISQKSGFYNEPVTVEITTDDDLAEIRYTLDGSVPNGTSNLYTEPLTFEATTVLRAISYITGVPVGTPASETYLINERKPELPVALLVTDPKNLFDDEIGIYVTGTNGIPGRCSDIPRNWNQDWERPVKFDYLNTNDKSVYNINAGLSVAGNCSRTLSKKSLSVTARNQYGGNKINYKFFDDKNIDSFKAIILRNNGYDFSYTLIFAQFVASLCNNMGIEYQATTPVVLYVNGSYWGIFTISEKLNEHYIVQNFNIKDTEFDFLENKNSIINGTNTDYNSLVYDFLEQHTSITDDEAYKFVTDRIDVYNYMDYITAETFIGNDDWAYNNIKFWKQKDGKWKWVLFDIDCSFGIVNEHPVSSPHIFDIQLLSNDEMHPDWTNRLFRRLITNEHFLDAFTQRYALHLQTTFEYSYTESLINDMVNSIQNEVPYDFERWQQCTESQWEQNVQKTKSFVKDRPQYMYQFLQERFGVEGPFNTKISIEGGEANIGLYGINTATTFEGLLFGKRPIQLEPSFDHKLYAIDHWQITTEEGEVVKIFEDTLKYTLTSNSDIRLVLTERTPAYTNDNAFHSNITVWPNPASTTVTISGGTDEISYVIYNFSGNELIKGTDRSIDVSSLLPGIYMLTIRENNNTTNNRIIIER